MFERIVIRQRSSQSIGQPIELGVIAEALLFYSDVLVVADYQTLRALLTVATPDVVVELVESGFLRLVYESDRFAVLTEGAGSSRERHDAAYFSAPIYRLQNVLPEILTELTGKAGRARRLARRLETRIEQLHLSEMDAAATRRELSDSEYVRSAVRKLLERLVPEYQGGCELTVSRDDKMLTVSTDIDFERANRAYHQRVSPSHSSLTSAYLLAHLVNVKSDLLVAARFGGELAIDQVNAEIMRGNLEGVLDKRVKSDQELKRFQEFVFDESRAVAEAIGNGQFTMADVLRLMPKATQFKEWIRRENIRKTC
jgi:hypothetical protein